MKSDSEKQALKSLKKLLGNKNVSKHFWNRVQQCEGKITFDAPFSGKVDGETMPSIERDVVSNEFGLVFINCNFKEMSFSTPHAFSFHDCTFEKCTLPKTSMLSRCKLKDSTISATVDTVIESNFEACIVSRSPSTAIKVSFQEGRCRFDHVENKYFEQTDFNNVTFNASTRFKDCTFLNCSMSRTAFFSLKDDGGLTAKNLNGIRITDSFIDLRKSLTGFNRWLNWAAILWFFLPYAAFIARRWTVHLISPDVGKTTLIEQLAKYVVSGGRTYTDWDFNFYKLAIFVLFLTYNLCRLTLLKIVIDHETAEQVEGRPKLLKPKEHWWRWMPGFVKKCFWIAMMLAFINTILFGLVKIPE